MRFLIARPCNSMGSSTVLGTSVCNSTSSMHLVDTIVLHPCPLFGVTKSILQLLEIADADGTQLLPSGQCFLWQEIASPKVTQRL